MEEGRQAVMYVDEWAGSGFGCWWDGREGRLKLLGDHSCIYLAVLMHALRSRSRRASTDGVPSRGPQLQALACTCTLAAASRLKHTSQFGTMEPCPFTDCGLVNLGWALAAGVQRASERWARQGSARTGASDAVRMGPY